MRRSTTFAVLLCAATVLVSASAGLAVATGRDQAAGPDGALAVLARSAQAAAATTAAIGSEPTGTEPTGSAWTGSATTGSPPTVIVTVPDLATTEAPPIPPPTARIATIGPVPSSPAADPATAQPPPPAQPADAPVNPPFSTVLGWHGDGKVAYLTFDDGPGPYTGRVLDILAAAGVKATFCEIGQRVVENPTLTQRVVTEGHTLCNHSWDHHSPFDELAAADLDQEIGQTQNAFLQATGVTVKYFRAPEGRFGNPGGAVLQAGQRAGTIPLGWGVDSLDWKKPGAAAIVSNVLSAVSPGAIILMHDGGGADREQTLAALPDVISGLAAAGYTLAPMPPDPAG